MSPAAGPTLEDLLKIPDNRDQLGRLKEQLASSGGVVPFVGAGLSVPCGMPGWARFLTEEVEGTGAEAIVAEQLARGEFEEAAAQLAAALGRRRFADRIESRFGPQRLDEGSLRGPALRVPELARGPVLTTNFDRVLEQVFDRAGRSFAERVWGAKPDLLGHALHANRAYLVKIHGDVLDSTDRVLTLDEYERHYGSRSVGSVNMRKPLPRVLEQVFTTRTLLFLGCSLGVDRTVLLLRRVADKHAAPPPHYAIVERPSSPVEANARARFLGELNIRTIWFPAGAYTAIDVLLDALLGAEPLPPSRTHRPGPRREPVYFHPLPREARFVGRESELSRLAERYASNRPGVVALVGIGGIGKSVLLGRFLETIHDADGVFVWSFYTDADPDRFIVQAYRYLTGRSPPQDKPMDRVYALCEALAGAGRVVLALDGLEFAQQRDDGRIGDATLRILVEKLAQGWGKALALITTRVPLTDLNWYRTVAYDELSLQELSTDDAAALLAECGVLGPREELAALAARFGSHALTISLLGTALHQFYGGDPARAAEITEVSKLAALDQVGKLRRVLRDYEQRLDERSIALLERISAFPRGVSADLLEAAFTKGGSASTAGALSDADGPTLRALLNKLRGLRLVQADTRGGETVFMAHPAIKEYFYDRLVRTNARGGVHEAVCRALSDLPVQWRPEADLELEKLEDFIHHARKAGQLNEAYTHYRSRLGFDHLGWRLGAYARGERIVHGFFVDGDPTRPLPGLSAEQHSFLVTEFGLFLRQLGELEHAAHCHDVALRLGGNQENGSGFLLHYLAHARLLQGSLNEVLRLAGDAQRLAEITGDKKAGQLAHIYLGAACTGLGQIDRARREFDEMPMLHREFSGHRSAFLAELLIRTGNLDQAGRLLRSYIESCELNGWHDDIVTCRLLLAEIASQEGQLGVAEDHLRAARAFALRASWQEALCRAHIVAARIHASQGRIDDAAGEVEHGTSLANHSGFGLLRVDLLTLGASLELGRDADLAARLAREAHRLASDRECGYAFGQADALDVLGQALHAKGIRDEAHDTLARALALRELITDPRSRDTRATLARLF